jgi:rod shape determining protein RodA
MLRRVAGYDTGLVASVFMLLGICLYLLFTAIVVPGGGELDQSFGWRQLVFSVVGLVGAVAISRIPLHVFERLWIPLYVGALGSIAVVFVLGTAIRGSRRWIEAGPVNLQPSETGKVLVILAVAGFLAGRVRDVQRPGMFLAVLGLCAVPALMVFVQPDFGTSQVYGYSALALLFFAGARWLHFAMLGGALVAVIVLVLGILPAVGVEVLHDFQKQRITGFLDPEADPRGSNYQAIQAKIAIGSGQLTGKSPDEASQVKQAFLPEPQTDFIFATLVERHGFVGGLALLLVYLLLVSRCLQAVAVAPTMYGRLVCGAIAMMFACQVMTNTGMVIGLMPITGVPMPLFSYGGSAMLANLAAVGFVAGVLRSAEAAPVRYARRASGMDLTRPRKGSAGRGGAGGRGTAPSRRRPVGHL